MRTRSFGAESLSTENLERIIAVSPFGAYSNLLKDIPLFSSLKKGERKGLLTALFEVKGRRTNPEVTYLPMESITSGLKGLARVPIDVLKYLVMLPRPKKKTPELIFLSKYNMDMEDSTIRLRNKPNIDKTPIAKGERQGA